jgi:hypothetical protein
MAGTGKTSIRSYSLYSEASTDNSNDFSHTTIPFIDQVDSTPFVSQGIIIKNDNAAAGADIQFSFDGTNVHGKVKAGEDVTFDFRRERQIWIRSSAASPFRFWAW